MNKIDLRFYELNNNTTQLLFSVRTLSQAPIFVTFWLISKRNIEKTF